MTGAAVVLEVVFVGAALVRRSIGHWRRTGDLGFRLGLGTGWPARAARVAMTIGLAMTFVALRLDLAGTIGRLPVLDDAATRVGGLGLIALSIGLVVRAQADLGDSWRIGVDRDERTELIVDGLFARMRNPIYTGMVTNAIGVAFAVPNWVAVVAPFVVLGGVELQVRGVEEPYLVSQHGEAFRRYTMRVGRFVPGVGRRARPRRAGPDNG